MRPHGGIQPAFSWAVECLNDTRVSLMEKSGVWSADCPVPLSRLVELVVSYFDFEGNCHSDGRLVIFDLFADRAAAIFEELFARRFPIESIRPICEFAGDDRLSMQANNSSCFNFRAIAGSNFVSLHGYGMAIDINPLQNPFIAFDEEEGRAEIQPCAAWQYLNRSNQKPGMLESVVEVFTRRGLNIWGGRWTTPIDYHHFQSERGLAVLLAGTSKLHGSLILEKIESSENSSWSRVDNDRAARLLDLYRQSETEFLALLDSDEFLNF